MVRAAQLLRNFGELPEKHLAVVSLKLQTSLKVSLFIGAILKCELSAGRKSIEICPEKNDPF